ncbi:MAG TPA: hypothetical protein VFK85_11585, partial [Anaeromyxobacteraceae bacterium]|nr:hypothetical protein [Anaeromyxobacteraceae bacterium]
IDDLCELTLLHGGDVVAVAEERMPSGSPVAAIITRQPLLGRRRRSGFGKTTRDGATWKRSDAHVQVDGDTAPVGYQAS